MMPIAITFVRTLASVHAIHLSDNRVRPLTILCVAARRSAEKCHRRNCNRCQRKLPHLQILNRSDNAIYRTQTAAPGCDWKSAVCHCKQRLGATLPSLGKASCYELFGWRRGSLLAI
jgi:hypothetical protein